MSDQITELKRLAHARPGGATKLASDLGCSEGHLSHVLNHRKGASIPLARKLLRIFPSLTLDDIPPVSADTRQAKKRQSPNRSRRAR